MLPRLFGSLVVLPLVILGLGSSWTWQRVVQPAESHCLTPAPGGRTGNRLSGSVVQLRRLGEGASWRGGVIIEPGGSLVVTLAEAVAELRLVVQADNNDSYRVAASADGESYRELWTVPAVDTAGLATRRSEILTAHPPIRFLRILPADGDGTFSVSDVYAETTGLSVDHRWLILVAWGSVFLLHILGRWSVCPRGLDAVTSAWSGADTWLTAGVAVAVLFRLPKDLVVIAAAAAVLAVVVGAWKHAVDRVGWARPLVAMVVTALALVAVFEIARRLITAPVAEVHELTVDHRMLPDGDEINAHGARLRGEASEIDESDHVVLFLGDSFTYGYLLEYDAAYPYQLESLASMEGCSPPVRAVNAGWTSASPLLAIRWLEDHGTDYRPDLVIYNLDVTDFHDDLRYEAALAAGGGDRVDIGMLRMLELGGERLRRSWFELKNFRRLLRFHHQRWQQLEGRLPADRFFVTSKPLAETRPDIDRGVGRNLEILAGLVERRLGCPLLVVLLPRAFQYSRNESLNSWEEQRYERLGRYALEPFRYFEETDPPYPVVSLLPAFQTAEEFPLYFDDDPHWNAQGAGVAARAVFDHLRSSGLVPCTPALASADGNR